MKTYQQVFDEVREQIYKNTGRYVSSVYINEWMCDHRLWVHPQIVTAQDIDKMTVIEHFLNEYPNESVVQYNNENVKEIRLVTYMGGGIDLEELLAKYDYQPIPDEEFGEWYLSLNIDNKCWADADASILDMFLQQIREFCEGV